MMTKRALVIGSQTYGLAGVNSDVELMVETLGRRGFQTRVHTDDNATRAAILAAYEQLIADTPMGGTDPVIVYYSGHGGRRELEGWQELQRHGRRSHLRYIVPFDMAATTETDFRGVLAEELSDLQRRLTMKTPNVTTILDCCYSGTMSRGDLLPKTLPRMVPVTGAMPFLEELDARIDDAGLDDSNKLAVRLVACDPTQSAYELPSSLGGYHGALTEQLVIALRELGDRTVSWRVLGDRLRRNISATVPLQRPEVEGPSDRVIFSLDVRSSAGALPASSAAGVVTIESARLFGISVGDRFRLLDEDERVIGDSTAITVDGDRATLRLDPPAPDDDGRAAPLDTAAVLAVALSRRCTRAVDLRVPAERKAALAARIDATLLLQVAGDEAPDTPPVTIVDDGGLVVLDGAGLAVNGEAFAVDAAGIGHAVTTAERVAKSDRLRGLASGGGMDDRLAGEVAVELASHHDGERVVRDRTGERLYPGEPISVSITNNTGQLLYIGLFDIDTAYNATLLSWDQPAGWKLPSGETKVVGGPDGVPLVWDKSVPTTGERLETLLVIAASEPQMFGLLETPKALGQRGASPSELESLLGEAATGYRNWPAGVEAQPVRYRVETIDFFLVPGTRPDVAEPPFAIREVPPLAQRMVRPRAAATAPTSVATRLTALRVTNNKALFRAAVRLDALVITATEDRVKATPFTQRFPGIASGDLVPADNLLLYHGPVRDFLDIAVWVNRDDTKGADLLHLFEESAADPGVHGALSVVGGLVLTVPQAALAVGAVSAIATLVRVTGTLIQAAVGKEIGLYRTSFLAHERFGLGRQPAEGLRRAQDIEFAFEIVDVG